MGGDRDGNPFVTPETTRDVVITARLSAINLYFTDIEQLMFELSNWRCSKEMKVLLSFEHCAGILMLPMHLPTLSAMTDFCCFSMQPYKRPNIADHVSLPVGTCRKSLSEAKPQRTFDC